MVDVNDETLQQLVERRLRELGGPGAPLSTRQLWLRAGEDAVSYETVRRIAMGTHTRIGDDVADALAIGLDVPVSHVLTAAGQRPRLGRFALPRKADRLNERERRTVLAVIETILEAHEGASHVGSPITQAGGTGVDEDSSTVLAFRPGELDRDDWDIPAGVTREQRRRPSAGPKGSGGGRQNDSNPQP